VALSLDFLCGVILNYHFHPTFACHLCLVLGELKVSLLDSAVTRPSAELPLPTMSSPCPSPSPVQQLQLQTLMRETPSPSRIPLPATNSPSPSPSFHVPGPSSRFNQRERSRPVHTRHISNYTPRGPILSTEQRAHRRAQSYADRALFAFPSPTPPTSDCGRSPLSRLPSFPGEHKMSSSSVSLNGAPCTPAKATRHRRHSSLLQDSPFSDYFTDDARSLESQSTPTSETQHLLVRLNKLQSQLMRGENAPEMLNIVGHCIGEIEDELEGLHSDSYLVEETEEEYEEDENEYFTQEERDIVLSSRPGSKHQPNPLGIEGISEHNESHHEITNWDKVRHEKLLVEAQTALRFLTEAQEKLRQRYQELVNLNEEHSLDMEEKEMEVERLRSENESLKSDLGFDHSELLFLELQLKSLEVDCEDSMYHPKLERLQRQMENWRDDWRDVEARFKKRRARYGVAAQGDKADETASARAEPDDDPKDWKVEVKKHGTRRVNSLTIRRVSNESEMDEQKQGLDEESTPTKAPASDLAATPRPRLLAQAQEQERQNQKDTPVATKNYVSQATQTTSVPISEKLALSINGSFSPVDDCAITTSPSSRADEYEDEEDDEDETNIEDKQSIPDPRTEQKRTALRELWSGLTDWAGLGDEDDW